MDAEDVELSLLDNMDEASSEKAESVSATGLSPGFRATGLCFDRNLMMTVAAA